MIMILYYFHYYLISDIFGVITHSDNTKEILCDDEYE